MRWKVVSERPLYGDEWLDDRVADVELPDGRHLDHRLIRTPPGAGVAAVDNAGRVLLIWRHRFITDSWGWEIPLGKVEEGESPIQAAAREFEEETGWRAGPLRHLIDVQPTPGISDSRHHVYVASTATQVGEPDGIESERTEWIPLPGLASLDRERRYGQRHHPCRAAVPPEQDQVIRLTAARGPAVAGIPACCRRGSAGFRSAMLSCRRGRRAGRSPL